MSKKPARSNLIGKCAIRRSPDLTASLVSIEGGLFVLQPLDERTGAPNGPIETRTSRQLESVSWWESWRVFRIFELRKLLSSTYVEPGLKAESERELAKLITPDDAAPKNGGSNGR